MTDAEIRTLKAVRSGGCTRRYSTNGNTMHGAPPTVLHKLAALGLICDGESHGSTGLTITAKLKLTRKGEAALAETEQ
jgi:hypothetical protein